MKVDLPDLTGAECGDIAITAAEGGIGYWARLDEYDWRRWSQEDDSLGNLEVADDFVFYVMRDMEEPNKALYVTPTFIRSGFERGLAADRDKGGWFFRRLLGQPREDWTGDIDAEGADLIMQFAAFGEVRYG